MSTLLQYALATQPQPLIASGDTGPLNTAVLTLVATNATAAAIPFEGVAVRLPLGEGATQLAVAGADITPIAPPNWKFDGAVSSPEGLEFIFIPHEGHAALAANASINFVFTHVAVNRSTGTAEVRVIEGAARTTTNDDPVRVLKVTKFPPGWGDIDFWVDDADLPYGGSPVLHWKGPVNATYSIRYNTPGGTVRVPADDAPAFGHSGVFPGTGYPPLNLKQLTIFTLHVDQHIHGEPYHAQAQVVVRVNVLPPLVRRFAVVPTDIDTATQPVPWVSLEWRTENVKSLYVQNVRTFTTDAREGAYPISPQFTRSYHATANGFDDAPDSPAYAEAWVNFVTSISTDYFRYSSFYPEPLNIGKVAGRDVFIVEPSLKPVGGSAVFTRYLRLVPGIEIANLGVPAAGTRAGYNEVIRGHYGTVVEPTLLWETIIEFDGSVPPNISEEVWATSPTVSKKTTQRAVNVGAAWGIRLEGGACALLWYDGAEHQEERHADFGFMIWKLNFKWILYPPLAVMGEESSE